MYEIIHVGVVSSWCALQEGSRGKSPSGIHWRCQILAWPTLDRSATSVLCIGGLSRYTFLSLCVEYKMLEYFVFKLQGAVRQKSDSSDYCWTEGVFHTCRYFPLEYIPSVVKNSTSSTMSKSMHIFNARIQISTYVDQRVI